MFTSPRRFPPSAANFPTQQLPPGNQPSGANSVTNPITLPPHVIERTYCQLNYSVVNVFYHYYFDRQDRLEARFVKYDGSDSEIKIPFI